MSNDKRQFGYRMRLFCLSGYNLTIRSDGTVLGTDDDSDSDSQVEITSGGDVSLVRILGLNSNLYLCFSSNGELYGEEDPSNEGTVFIEDYQGLNFTYKSTLYPEWYVGIKKNGHPKKGNRTKSGQKAIQFLPRRF